MFARELQRRAGDRLLVAAAHPGYAATNLQSHHASRLARAGMWLGNKVVATSAAVGARPTVLAVVGDLPPDTYVGPTRLGQSRGAPGPVDRSAEARDEAVARRLWEVSEERTGVVWPL